MSVSAQCPRWSWLLGGLFGLLLAGVLVAGLVLIPGAAQGLEAQPWVLRDQAGRVWSLTLLEQGDPAYPAGRRLRLTDRSGTQQLDHDRPLQLRDGMGVPGSWPTTATSWCRLARRSYPPVQPNSTWLVWSPGPEPSCPWFWRCRS